MLKPHRVMDYMADVKAIFVADVIATVSLYLPMFLLRDGLLALMYRASFMVLKRFWSSLPKMVKLSIVTS